MQEQLEIMGCIKESESCFRTNSKQFIRLSRSIERKNFLQAPTTTNIEPNGGHFRPSKKFGREFSANKF